MINTNDYLREGYRLLSDKKFYTKLHHDPTTQIHDRIRKTLTEKRDEKLISDKNLEYLSPDSYSEGKFYLLPKIYT